MPVTPKPLADGQLAATKTTLYTAASSAGIKFFRLVNTDTVARTVNIYLNVSGTSRRIVPKDYSIAPGAMVPVLEVGEVVSLESGDLIEGSASAAGVVDYVITGGTLS